MCKVLGVGIDLCRITRMEDPQTQSRLLARCFTQAEASYIAGRGRAAAQSMAGMWAAKEACVKALGVGISLPLQEIEILHTDLGQPCYRLTGKALEASCSGRMMLSITHEGDMAAAVCVWQK